jgi:hypothetical protein
MYPKWDATIANVSKSNYYVLQDGTRNSSQIGSWDWRDNPTKGLYAFQGRNLQQYDLPVLPVDATIVSAKLKMYMWPGGTPQTWNSTYITIDQNPTLEVRKVTQAWDEGKGTGFIDGYQYTGATWTRRTANSNWSTTGGSFDPTVIASKQQARAYGWWEFDVKNLVNSWYATPSTNFGLMVKYVADQTAKGGMWLQTREDETTSYGASLGPYIEVEYNTPPEKPRGLSPNFDSFICQDLAHTMRFKWTFNDTAGPPALGKADVVFVINTNPSMQSRLSFIKTQVSRFIDRMVAEKVDWNVGYVAFGSILANQPVVRYGMFDDKAKALAAFDTIVRYPKTSYLKSGLEALMDATNGALSFPFRDRSKVQFVMCADSPFHDRQGLDGYYVNGSAHTVDEVIQQLLIKGIPTSMTTNTHCGSYTQLRLFPDGTKGLYLEESYTWAEQLQILTIMSAAEEALAYETDTQSKAVLRIWRINSDGTRTLIGNPTFDGASQDVNLKGLGLPWVVGAAYEWDVVTYDKYDVPSPASDKARFNYIVDVNALIGVPMYSEPVVLNNTINKKALMEIRTKLYDEVRKYRNMDPGQVLKLFEGDVVPSKSDMSKLQSIVSGILQNDGLVGLSQDIIGDTLGVSDITALRDALTNAAMSPPDQPAGGTATWTEGRVHRPLTLSAVNDSPTDTTISVTWTPAEATGSGWVVKLGPSQDTDINYYKIYNEEIINYLSTADSTVRKPILFLNEVYMKSEQIINGTVFIPYTGRADSHKIYYTSHDMNGRSCLSLANVTISGNATAQSLTVSSYVVEYQTKYWTAEKPDPTDLWYPAYSGTSKSFTHTVTGEGTYWYRVKAVLSDGQSTDWTYSIDAPYIKY